MTAKAISLNEDGASKFGKLLPSEVTALYLSLRPLVVDAYPTLHLAVGILSIFLAVAFIRSVRGVKSWGHTLIYTLTFGVWVLTLEPAGMAYWLTQTWQFTTGDVKFYTVLGAITSILWTFIVTNLVPTSFVTTERPVEEQKADESEAHSGARELAALQE